MEKITKQQIDELINAAHYSQDTILVRRAQAILLLEDGATMATMKVITGYKRPVAIKHRKKYIKYGLEVLASKKKEAKLQTHLTSTQKELIIKMVQTQLPKDFGFNSFPTWNTRVLSYIIKEHFGVQYKSRTSFYLLFKAARFTFHKPDKVSEKRNPAAVETWKKDILPLIKAEYNKANTVVFVEDEAALSSQTRVQRAWLPSDRSVEIQDTTKRKLVHLYGFLNIQSGDAIAYKTEKQTGSITVSVLKKLAKDFANKQIVIVWDNASWHKSKEIREFLATTDQFKLYNFPPYSPDLNPQEHVWKDLRERILNNRLIVDINEVTQRALEYIKNTNFDYAF